MSSLRWNWPLWAGLALTLTAFLSYFLLFALFPITRDVPWANFILFVAAIALLIAGFRRAPSRVRRIVAGVVAFFGFSVTALFIAYLGFSRHMPASGGAPRVGQKAPGFTLLDANRQPVSLDQLLATSPKGVLLIFYRGWW